VPDQRHGSIESFQRLYTGGARCFRHAGRRAAAVPHAAVLFPCHWIDEAEPVAEIECRDSLPADRASMMAGAGLSPDIRYRRSTLRNPD